MYKECLLLSGAGLSEAEKSLSKTDSLTLENICGRVNTIAVNLKNVSAE
ncbi:MAG TPA: hypothetical protein VNW99_05870 [Cytophagaceae bacterium]|jgi:hypothetical protein|nr:hypothetical protein [Cytophagaceae bacterium]